ncbi:DUF6286 domain-containing protein [Corynebacterium uberis]|uniref:DUF6286 domain-containing protein n=1 Tax=Corynebacterium TaxID=1716 RepID=UPI001D0AF513|nr:MULTISPECIES: DUF6286 domain-containing protein [Corynebacterium]MCZ9309436.1 alkaline shock response membrane anchor protein AmaP [Corynebacterium sp. c6VSa_13]UDL72985.1 alkaline shock response membrane anchor protein AmaP [Corynebacterium uberis]UDL76138.1 alkaline shock response membrane anchor protein AmaP [Corynebacterium uberis]UDL78350.1 alkaline shock response membrane anchor protein AmaP [Corynebacterium uberis]UDL80633.1 alkaline shock response membrane anchor protein AmaP [Coryn
MAESADITFHPGQEPKGSPIARGTAILLGLVLIGIAAVAGRELWIHYSDSTTWTSWLNPLADNLAQNRFQDWMIPAAILSLLVGIVLFVIALRPRRRTHRQLTSEVSLWARPVDIARYSTASAKRVPGVSSASTTVKRNGITLAADCSSADPALEERVRSSVQARLAPIVGDTPLSVRLTRPDYTQQTQEVN